MDVISDDNNKTLACTSDFDCEKGWLKCLLATHLFENVYFHVCRSKLDVLVIDCSLQKAGAKYQRICVSELLGDAFSIVMS